jgi:hypothetical protein
LSVSDRQRLVEGFFQVAGRAYTPAWYEPQVAYTLRREEAIEVWDDAFESNELGFRAPSVRKPPGTFRLLVVGDSWTYGMGVGFDESFPGQLQTLVSAMVPEQQIEIWPLALPGYNTLNETGAIEVFFDRIQPDAVVLCPTRNDNDSNFFVLPSGANRRPTGRFVDRFGLDHAVMYPYRFLDSFRYLDRWRIAFSEMQKTEAWLESRGVPFSLFFVAYWDEPFVHRFMQEVNASALYAIGPKEFANPGFKGPPPYHHGTADSYRVYSRILYRLVAKRLGWPQLPLDPSLDAIDSTPFEGQFFDRVPPGDWVEASGPGIRRWSKHVPESYRSGSRESHACVGSMDCASGLMGRATTVVLRRARNATKLQITVSPVEGETVLYPLEFSASIPTMKDPSHAETIVSGDASEHSFELEIPESIPVGTVLDVELRAARATLERKSLVLRSVRVQEIRPLP